MARPGRNIERALLASGRALYAARGAARLSVRAVTEHAGVNLGMFHYHFQSKDAFLRQLLDTLYEDMFRQLSVSVESGPTLQRLREALRVLARFVREHGRTLGRVLADAAAGHAVAVEFLRTHAPRHLKLLLALMDQAQREGRIREMAPLQRFIFVMSGVAMPLLVAPLVLSLGVAPEVLKRGIKAQVMTDEAIDERIELVLKAIAAPRKKAA